MGFSCKENCDCKWSESRKGKDCYTRQRVYETEIRPETRYRRKYGIGVADVLMMEMQQNHACALCKEIPPPRGKGKKIGKSNGKKGSHGLVIDHNHETGKVRALLCQPCNILVGSYEKMKRLNIEAELEEYVKMEYKNGLGNV